MAAGRRLTFRDFPLDLTSERLWYRDEVAPLTPKAFAVLRRLVEDRGQLVSKEELLRAGWPKTHVSEGVLKVIILEIRRALGDDPAAPSFIETVPRRGYRFIGPRARQASVAAAVDPRGALVGRDRVLAQLEDRLASGRGRHVRPARAHAGGSRGRGSMHRAGTSAPPLSRPPSGRRGRRLGALRPSRVAVLVAGRSRPERSAVDLHDTAAELLPCHRFEQRP